MIYVEDVLKNGFEQSTIFQPDDYEGKVTATLIRKRNPNTTSKALLYIHGFNDYFFQENVADEFLKNGYHFYALDLRKYGRSILENQKPNNVRDLTEYYGDIDSALSIIKEEGSNQILLYGHSTGGLVITLYAFDRKGNEQFDALICNSPFYDFNVSWIEKKVVIPLLSVFGTLNPDLKLPVSFSRYYGKSLHKDDFGEWFYNLNWKPHFASAINTGWIKAIYQGHMKISNGVTINKPILILHSAISVYPSKWGEEMFEGDAILNVNDITQRSKCIQSPHKMLLGFEGAMHDVVLSRKPTRDFVFESLFKWLGDMEDVFTFKKK